MILRLRLLDKKSGEVIPVQRIDFKDGYPITVFVDGQEWSAAKYEIQRHDDFSREEWKAAQLSFETP